MALHQQPSVQTRDKRTERDKQLNESRKMLFLKDVLKGSAQVKKRQKSLI